MTMMLICILLYERYDKEIKYDDTCRMNQTSILKTAFAILF